MKTLLVCVALVAAPVTVLPEAQAQEIGPTTGKPLPRFVSIKKRARARRGPSTDYKIDWVYEHLNLPVRVVQEFEHWRRVEDSEGFGGWIHYALLSNTRFVVFTRDRHEIRYDPTMVSKVMARAEVGVVARLDRCEPDWCRVRVDEHRGWTHKSGIWGVEGTETID